MDKIRVFFLLFLIYCAYLVFFKSYNKKNHCFCLNYYIMISTGILAVIFLLFHKKYHNCNILEIYNKNERVELFIFIIIFVIISAIVCFLNYSLFRNKNKLGNKLGNKIINKK